MREGRVAEKKDLQFVKMLKEKGNKDGTGSAENKTNCRVN